MPLGVSGDHQGGPAYSLRWGPRYRSDIIPGV